MIISASRRTDIPKFFSEWMENRIREGFVDVRNPFRSSQVSRYSLSPDIVDGIVFWTKDPEPMLKRLHAFDDYAYYFQFTLTPYGKDIEENMPDKHELIKTFKELSSRIGNDRVIWRYDPILLNSQYEAARIIRAFKTIAAELKGFTKQVIFSFLDDYRIDGKSIYDSLSAKKIAAVQQNQIAEQIADIARDNGMTVSTCAEAIDLNRYNIEHARCVDSRIFEKLNNSKLSRLKNKYEEIAKDPSQRKECLCVDSIDIGWPNICMNGCKYCYATTNTAELDKNFKKHNPLSTLLCGELLDGEKVTDHRGSGDQKDRSYRFTEKRDSEPKSEQLTFDGLAAFSGQGEK
jgi:hypothetical protein